MSIRRPDITLVEGPRHGADIIVYVGSIQVARIWSIHQRNEKRYCCEHTTKSYKSPENLVNALLTLLNRKYTKYTDDE